MLPAHVKRFVCVFKSSAHLDVVQHQLFLPKVQGTVGTFEHGDFLIDDMLVEVRAEEGLQREHRVAHGALVDHPERGKTVLLAQSHEDTDGW